MPAPHTYTAPTRTKHVHTSQMIVGVCRYCRIVAAEVLGRVSMEWGNRAAIEQAGAVDPLINLLHLNHSPGVISLTSPPPTPTPLPTPFPPSWLFSASLWSRQMSSQLQYVAGKPVILLGQIWATAGAPPALLCLSCIACCWFACLQLRVHLFCKQDLFCYSRPTCHTAILDLEQQAPHMLLTCSSLESHTPAVYCQVPLYCS